MKSLLEIGDELAGVLAKIEDNDGEIPPEVEEFFSSLGEQAAKKLDSYVALIREFQLRAAARKEEAERIAKRAAVDENAAKALKERLKMFMEVTGQHRIDTDRYLVTLANNGGVQPYEMTCKPSELPEEYRVTEYRPRTEDIRAALIAGIEIPGCTRKPRGTHVSIR